MKGIFIPDITVEMFRDGCLESIETLMAEGEIYDIEYDPKSAQPERKNGKWIEKEGNAYKCSCCGKQIITNPDYIKAHKFCFSCGADMRGGEQDG